MSETIRGRHNKLGAVRRLETPNRAALLSHRTSGGNSRSAHTPRPASGPELRTRYPQELTLRARLRGQAAVIVALSMLFLILIVGLAIDGGASYGLRRQAQNASDGSALAGTRNMLTYYEQMILDNPNGDVDGTAAQEQDILSATFRYAALNNVLTNTLHAYFVNDDKQIVSVASNPLAPGGPCGTLVGQPCEVGQNGLVPWTMGVKGINIKSRATTGSSFMRIIGWDNVAASASATAFMGVGASQDDISVVPIALFTNTTTIHFVPGNGYTLLNNDNTFGSGNWGWVDFNGQGTSAVTVGAWLDCGFNPIVDSAASWATWCPSDRNANGFGPTQHFRPVENPSPPDNYDPDPTAFFIPSIVYGPGRDGWWLAGSSGGVNSNCQSFRNRINAGGSEGTDILFPIFDRQIGGGGGGTMYHVRVIVAFTLYQNDPLTGSNDVQCHTNQIPTPTPCGACSTPTPGPNGGGNVEHWYIHGIAKQVYSRSSSGRHGSLRSVSDHVVFLDN